MAGNRGWFQTLTDMLGGVSKSEYQGAHNDIDKLIKRADKDAMLSKLFTVEEGRHTGGVYRYLNPKDSTVTLLQGMVDRYYGNYGISTEDRIRRDALRHVESPTSQSYAASLLARLRNE